MGNLYSIYLIRMLIIQCIQSFIIFNPPDGASVTHHKQIRVSGRQQELTINVVFLGAVRQIPVL